MTETPDGLHFTQDHTWARMERGEVTVGVTDFAQRQIGDVVFIELPTTDGRVTAGEPVGIIEGVSVTELVTPVSGTMVAVNDSLNDAPDQINTSPYRDGWIFRVIADDQREFDQLMDATAYDEFVTQEPE